MKVEVRASQGAVLAGGARAGRRGRDAGEPTTRLRLVRPEFMAGAIECHLLKMDVASGNRHNVYFLYSSHELFVYDDVNL